MWALQLVLCFILFVCYSASDIEYGPDPYTSIVKGVFFQEITTAVIYQKSVPLNFVVDLPIVSFDTTYSNCSCEKFLCDLKHEAEQIHSLIIDDTIRNHPYLANPQSRSTRSLFPVIGEIDKFLFGLATSRDVSDLHLSQVVLAARQKEIQDAVVEDHKYVGEVVKNISAWNEALTHTFEVGLSRIKSTLAEVAETVWKEEGVLSEIATLTLKNQYLIYVTSKISAAADSCRNGKIPRGVLSDAVLQKRIRKLLHDLGDDGYEPATNLNGLFKMNVAECYFTKQQMHVTVHLPIRRVGQTYKMFEVFTVPYRFRKQECNVLDVPDYLAVIGGVVMPVTGVVAKHCKPHETNFCHIPENERDSSSFSTCANSLFNQESVDIKKNCIMKCTDSNVTRITEISPGHVAVTNAHTINVVCSEPPRNISYKVPADVGAISLKLPCFCSALVNNNRKIFGSFPCLSSTKVIKEEILIMIPAQMSILSGASLDDYAKFSNLSEILDERWVDKLPTFNITPPLPIQFSTSYIIDQFSFDLTQSKFTVMTWLLLLTGAYAFLIFKLYCKTDGHFSLSKMLFFCFVSGVGAEEQSSDLKGAVQSLLKAIAVGDVIIAVIIGLSGLVLVWVVWKMFRLIQCVYKMVRSLVDDISPSPTRRL